MKQTYTPISSSHITHPFPPVPSPLSSINLIILLRHPHISINSRTKRRKARTTRSSSLRAGLRTQNTTSNATRGHRIRQIILGPQSLNTALRTRVQRTHDTEVLGAGPRPLAHVFEAATYLLFPGEVGDRFALGGEGGVVGHLYIYQDSDISIEFKEGIWEEGEAYASHKQTEDTTQTETHCSGHDGLHGAGFHGGVHLSF